MPKYRMSIFSLKALGAALGAALCCAVSGAPDVAAQEPGPPDRPISSLLSEKRLREYNRNPKYKGRIDIFREAYDDLASHLADDLKKMDMEKVFQDLRDMRALAGHVQNEPTRGAASAKDLRSKEVKKLEIRIRKLTAALDDYRLSVPFDDRGEFEATVNELEGLRNQLLIQLFGKAAARPQDPDPWNS
ncbi:MAG: hypothetical protein FJW35_11975 [Acidobacteria bacterium]|nr:hypothetical protein [Acidobacteriota bacterium]